jgi:quercetin dioxygenase-like cupin family protein
MRINLGITLAAFALVSAGCSGKPKFESGTADTTKESTQPVSLVWGPAPGVFPAGAKMAVVSGDPSKEGEFQVQLSFPDRYKIPPHFHPTDEVLEVKEGTFLVGKGDKLDPKKATPMEKGAKGTMPAGMHHFGIAQGATVVAVSAQGPFAMTYVNPADDPSKRGATQ